MMTFKIEKDRADDSLTKYLKGFSPRKMEHLSQRTGLTKEAIESIRDNPDKSIRYFDVLRLINASHGDLKIDDVRDRNIKDLEKYDNPLGRKIADVLCKEDCFTRVLDKHGIAHVELIRWLTENTRWSESTKQKIKTAFSCGKIQITDDDFEEQKVDRLRVAYERARDAFELKKSKA